MHSISRLNHQKWSVELAAAERYYLFPLILNQVSAHCLWAQERSSLQEQPRNMPEPDSAAALSRPRWQMRQFLSAVSGLALAISASPASRSTSPSEHSDTHDFLLPPPSASASPALAPAPERTDAHVEMKSSRATEPWRECDRHEWSSASEKRWLPLSSSELSSASPPPPPPPPPTWRAGSALESAAAAGAIVNACSPSFTIAHAKQTYQKKKQFEKKRKRITRNCFYTKSGQEQRREQANKNRRKRALNTHSCSYRLLQSWRCATTQAMRPITGSNHPRKIQAASRF